MIILLVLLTGLVQLAQHKLVAVGAPPDYLGLLTWLAFIMAAVLFQENVQELILRPLSLYIFGVVMVISLLYNTFFIRNGIRIPGVMFQPTTLAMYANAALIIALYRADISTKWNKIVPWLIFLIAIVVIGLCQSRLGDAMLITTLIVWICIEIKRRQIIVPIILTTIIAAATSMPLIYGTYFSRLRSKSFTRSISYRFDLYKVSAKDVVRHNFIKGNGPGTLPTAINDPSQVNSDVAQTLQFGLKFNSTHDLFFDFAYYYGLLATLSLLAFIWWSVKHYIRSKQENVFVYGLIFLCLLLNALFNIPSLELTSMFFVVLFGLAVTPYTVGKNELGV